MKFWKWKQYETILKLESVVAELSYSSSTDHSTQWAPLSVHAKLRNEPATGMLSRGSSLPSSLITAVGTFTMQPWRSSPEFLVWSSTNSSDCLCPEHYVAACKERNWNYELWMNSNWLHVCMSLHGVSFACGPLLNLFCQPVRPVSLSLRLHPFWMMWPKPDKTKPKIPERWSTVNSNGNVLHKFFGFSAIISFSVTVYMSYVCIIYI